MGHEPELVELAEAEQESSISRITAGTDHAKVHAWLRTAAALVAALSAVWVATAVADMRDVDEKKLCWDQVQSSIPTYAPGPLRPQWVDQLVQQAEECDLPVLADAIRQRYADE